MATRTSFPARSAARINGSIGSTCPYAGHDVNSTRAMPAVCHVALHRSTDFGCSRSGDNLAGLGYFPCTRFTGTTPNPLPWATPSSGARRRAGPSSVGTTKLVLRTPACLVVVSPGWCQALLRRQEGVSHATRPWVRRRGRHAWRRSRAKTRAVSGPGTTGCCASTRPSGEYEAALDVDTPSGIGVSYRVVTDLTTASIPRLAALPDGFPPLASTSSSGALDYVRSPLLRDGWMVQRRAPFARRTQPRVPARARSRGVPRRSTSLGRFHRWFRLAWRPLAVLPLGPAATATRPSTCSRRSSGAAVRIYIFGSPFTPGLGVHNVHINQGDPPGPHQANNGIWQDGAVLTQATDGKVTVWQVKFNTQSLHTSNNWPVHLSPSLSL